ncbi:MAG: Mrp/NBP35 family ATP-binding protein [Candidatus Cloacimonetes bacterium]|nr:Mrp/NBP35 family ATP-binding protein [Candidatus Cloacimonadota bacterium]
MQLEITQVLESVLEPNLKKNIIELGMLDRIEIDNHIVRIHLNLPHVDEDTRTALKDHCSRAVMQLGDFDVRIKMRPRDNRAWHNVKVPQGVKNVRHIVLVVSGKGGVGKSTVSTNLALALSQQGQKVGLLDCDIYGPSIPTMMGIRETPRLNEDQKLIPVEKFGIPLISSGFLIEPDKALIWRGPMIHKIVSQFLGDVLWGDLDILLVDLPPGTGDVQLSMAQSTSVRGAVLVTTPQQVAIDDVKRAYSMLETLKIPVLGIVENMAGFNVPGSNEVISMFSKGGGQKLADQYHTSLLAQIPLNPTVCTCGDEGIPIVLKEPGSLVSDAFLSAARNLCTQLEHFERDGIFSLATETKR